MVEAKENPLINISSTTVEAFNIIKNKEKEGKKAILGRDDTLENTTNHAVVVYVYTPQDEQKHRYFHSLSIDKQVEDFMGTAELRCPYDSDLMEYWEPIRNYCIIYGSNKGESNAKILFIGRVRGIKQEGYELVITFQDYGWKFKQLVTQSYANDNVINKDGYTIMKLMFEALKIDSWVINPAAIKRLKQVGYDSDGNLTLNKKKVEEMPDLLKRLESSDPNDAVNKWTLTNKLKEQKEGNIKNINYTLRYEKPTPVMKKISSEGSGEYSAGQSLYGTNYGSGGGGTGGSSSSSNKANSTTSASGNPRPPANLCSSIGNSQVIAAMKVFWSYNRGYTNEYSDARKVVLNYAENNSTAYLSKVSPCLNTLKKYCSRKDKNNIAATVKSEADSKASHVKATANLGRQVTNVIVGTVNKGSKALNQVKHGDWKGALKTIFS